MTSGKDPSPLTFTFIRKDGSQIPVSLKINYLLDKNGNPQNIIGSFHDISDILQVERELDQMFNLGTPVCLIGKDYQMLRVNDNFCSYFGMKREDVVGKICYEIWQETVCNTPDCMLQQILSGKDRDNYDVTEKMLPDGRVISCRVQAFAYKDINGNVIGVVESFQDITDLKNTEKVLLVNEAKFRSVFENSPLGKSMTGIDGSLNMNKRFCEILGYSDEELRKKAWQEITYPDDIQESTDIIQSLIDGKRTHAHYEKRYLHKNGQIVWTDINTTLQRDKNGKPLYFITTVADITNRKKDDIELYNSRQMLRLVLDNIPQRVFWKDINLNYLGCNQAFAQDAHLDSPDGIIGKDDYQLSWKDTAELYRSDDQEVIRTNTPKIGFEEPQSLPEGGQLWLRTNKIPLQDMNGKVIGVLGTYEDITLQREAEEKIRLSEQKFRTLFEAEPDAIMTADPATGLLLEVNKAATRLFGRPAEKLVGLHQTELHPPEMRDNIIKKFREITIEGSTKPHEILVQNADGKIIPAEVVGSVAELGGKPVAIGIFRDITDRKKTEQEILREKKITDSTIDAVPGIFYQISPEGRFVRWNNQFESISQYSSEEIGKMHPLDLFNEPEKEKVGSAIQKVFTDGYADVEADFIAKDGTATPHLFTGKLFIIENEPYLIGMGMDISDLKRIETNLRKSNAELEAFNKMAVGREKRMIELKRMINELSEKLGENPPYDMTFSEEML